MNVKREIILAVNRVNRRFGFGWVLESTGSGCWQILEETTGRSVSPSLNRKEMLLSWIFGVEGGLEELIRKAEAGALSPPIGPNTPSAIRRIILTICLAAMPSPQDSPSAIGTDRPRSSTCPADPAAQTGE